MPAIWSQSDNWLSNMTPRSRADCTTLTVEDRTGMSSMSICCSRCPTPGHRNSVLDGLKRSLWGYCLNFFGKLLSIDSNLLLQITTNSAQTYNISCKWRSLLLRLRERWRIIVMNMYVCVCVSVCLSARISPKSHARSLPIFLCMLPMAMDRSSGRLTKSQAEGAILGVLLSSLLTMHCNAFVAKGITESPITS